MLRLAGALLALLAACTAPPPGPAGEAPGAWFEAVPAQQLPRFTYQSGHRERFLFPEIMGGGGALFDFDGDGDLDLYLVQGGRLDGSSPQPGNQLWRNRGDGSFEDVSAGSGSDDRGYGMGVAVGDVDGDGDPDLYVTNVGRNTLLRNDCAEAGRVLFSDVTEEAGAGDPGWSTSAAFFDADADGDLDLFVAHYVVWSLATDLACENAAGRPDYCSPLSYAAPAPDTLLRNEGEDSSGRLRVSDVSSAAGLRTAFGNGLGVVAADFDGDGRTDLFVANDQTPNQLWQNRGDGSFVDRALERGCAVDEGGRPKAGMGSAAADVDDDGDLDLLVVNLQAQSDSFFRNESGTFRDATAAAGLALPTRRFTRFGTGFADFDQDGFLDLYVAAGRVTLGDLAGASAADPFAEPNTLLRGTATGRFEPVAPAGGTRSALVATSRGTSFGDLDGDGGVDLVVVNREAPPHLLRNVVAGRGGYIRFRLLEHSGADALGASVAVTLGERRLRRDVAAAYGYGAAHDPRVHVGLGAATVVHAVLVTWPDGDRWQLPPLPAGHDVVVRRAPPSR